MKIEALKELAVKPKIQRLWRASKLLGVPIYSEKLNDMNVFDMAFMDWLIYFEDQENVRKYKNSFFDQDFEDYFNEEAPPVDMAEFDVNNADEWEEVTDE